MTKNKILIFNRRALLSLALECACGSSIQRAVCAQRTNTSNRSSAATITTTSASTFALANPAFVLAWARDALSTLERRVALVVRGNTAAAAAAAVAAAAHGAIDDGDAWLCGAGRSVRRRWSALAFARLDELYRIATALQARHDAEFDVNDVVGNNNDTHDNDNGRGALLVDVCVRALAAAQRLECGTFIVESIARSDDAVDRARLLRAVGSVCLKLCRYYALSQRRT